MLQFKGIDIDYSRTEKTLLSRQNLSQLKTLVIGAGALGNAVVQALGLLGVGAVYIADDDVVEESNLTRSVLLRFNECVGKLKAGALAQSARNVFRDTGWEAMNCEFADIGFGAIREMDILFSCVDSESARTEIAYVSTLLNVPCSDAGLGGNDYARGRISYFPGRNAACFCCGLPMQKRSQILTTWDSGTHNCIAPAEGSRRPFPSTPTMAAMIGSMQVELGLRSRLRDESESFTVELDLENTATLRTWSIPQSVECPFHDESSEDRIPSGHGSTAADVLRLVGPGSTLMLDWPVCTEAVCLDCEHTWSPYQRLGRFRRSARCPQCHSSRLVPRQVVRSIDSGSKWAEIPLAQFGISDDHLHAVALVSDSEKS